MATDTKIPQLIINEMTRAQYEALAEVSESEIYVITDDEATVVTNGTNITGTGTTSDPIALSQEIVTKIDNNTTNLSTHTANESNPHKVTKAQIGLGNVDNTSDANKPISVAQQAALDLKANQSTTYTKTEVDNLVNTKLNISDAESTYATVENLQNHIDNTSNPHNVTKAQVGLGNVDNTSDANKPVSTATQAALDKLDKEYKAADTVINNNLTTVNETIETLENSLTSHIDNVSNPHSVTKAQIGLGNVNNTSDANKPVSTAQQAALDLKADKATTYTKTETDGAIETALEEYVKFTDYSGQDKAGVIKTSSGLGMAISATGYPLAVTATKSEYDSANTTYFIGKGTLENIKDDYVKRGLTENSITLTDTEKESARTWIGAGSQEDVTSIETDISTIESKIPSTASSTNLLADRDFVNSSINNLAAFYLTSNEAGDAFPTKAALVAGPHYFQGTVRTPTLNDYAIVIADETKENAATRYMYDGAQWDFQYEINDTPFTQEQVNAINSTATKDKIDSYSAHIINKSNPHSVTKAQVGLGNVDNTSDLNKPISTATQEALNDISTDLSNHINDVENPHKVTKTQIGLGNVDNTSDANKPISTATQTALDTITRNITNISETVSTHTETLEQVNTTLTEVSGNLNTHTTNISNPHKVTKTQIGLGNVDNTSDIDKPISTATQEALDLKANADEYVKKSGDTMSGSLYFKGSDSDSSQFSISANSSGNGIMFNGYITITSNAILPPLITSQNKDLGGALSSLSWDNLYVENIANGSGGKLAVPKEAGTLARIEDIPEVPVSSVNSKTGEVVLNTEDINATNGEETITLQAALDLKANQSTTYTKTEVDNKIAEFEAFPDQTNNNGKILTTNGTETSWTDMPGLIIRRL